VKSSVSNLPFSRRYLILMVILAIAIYFIVPQIGDFKNSWQIALDPEPEWLILAVIFTAIPYLAAAGIYYSLSFKPLNYPITVLAQIAANFINRVLPAGVGGMGANYLYLRRQKHTQSQAAAVVGINNILGFVGHLLITGVVLFAISNTKNFIPDISNAGSSIFKYLALFLIALAVLTIIFGRQRLQNFFADFVKQLNKFRQRPLRLLLALILSICLTMASVMSLFCIAEALGVDLSFAEALIIFTVGLGVGTATPTPGGLGGFELGMVTALGAYNVGYSSALAVTLLFRLITYWVPLTVGLIAFIEAQRRRLFMGG
jgi:glycosyltransferase 2 family protein